MTNLGTILGILQFVRATAIAVCSTIDKAIELEHEERQALKELGKAVESLKSDTVVYQVLLNAILGDTDVNGRCAYTCFIQLYVLGLRSTSYAHIVKVYGITDRTERTQ